VARLNIYTVMLALSLIALLIGCAVLFAEWSRYGRGVKPPVVGSLDRPTLSHLSQHALGGRMPPGLAV